MTPPEHIFIGFSLANIIFSVQTFLKKRYVSYIAIICCSLVLSALPDVDSFTGYYTSTNVYRGHRGITHSAVFILLVSLVCAPLVSIIAAWRKYKFPDTIKIFFILFSALALSGLSHLIADLPQPPGAWGGIPLFYPLQTGGEFIRTGGWSKIGWYDFRILWAYVYLFVASAFLIYISDIGKLNSIRKSIAALVILLNLFVNIWTINYINDSKYISREKWSDYQKEYIENSNDTVKRISLAGKKSFLLLFNHVVR